MRLQIWRIIQNTSKLLQIIWYNVSRMNRNTERDQKEFGKELLIHDFRTLVKLDLTML